MAETIIKVTKQGQPVVGVQVIVGEHTKHPEFTDENGEITLTVPSDFAIAANVIVLGGAFELGMASVVIRASNTLLVEV